MAEHCQRWRARPLLGTRVAIRAESATPPAALDAAIDAAFAAIEAVQRLMSFHAPDSDVSRLNREAASRPVRVDRQTFEVLTAALGFSLASRGAFDITTASVLEGSGLLPRLDSPADTAADWRDIELLDDDRVRFRRPLHLDLGGIAKGHAVDRAVTVLRAAGVESALVEAGGDLRACGPRGYRIGLRDPRHPGARPLSIELRDAAMATSAASFSRKRLDARVVSALVSPRDRASFTEAATVSVQAPTCRTADALTKVALFAPPALANVVLARFDAAAIRLQPRPAMRERSAIGPVSAQC